MFGAIAKTYFAEKIGIGRKDLVVVSIMPCLAKKYECRERNSQQMATGCRLFYINQGIGCLHKQANIDLNNLESEEFDSPMENQQEPV